MDAHDVDSMSYVADAVVIDFAANTIRVRVPEFPGGGRERQPALLDVGSNGRLIGLEIGEWYVTVMDVPGAEDPYVRSADVLVDISGETPPSIEIPRRGGAYEITYPSGNECWQMKNVNGELVQVCATIADEPSALHAAREHRSGHTPTRP